QSLETGTFTLSEDLIALLMSQEPIRERLRAERLQGLAEYENRLSGFSQELEQRQEMLNEWETTIDDRQRKNQQEQERLETRIADLEELRATLYQSRTSAQSRDERLTPFHSFASEAELVNHIKDFIQGSGFHYDPWIIENFYTCLKTD